MRSRDNFKENHGVILSLKLAPSTCLVSNNLRSGKRNHELLRFGDCFFHLEGIHGRKTGFVIESKPKFRGIFSLRLQYGAKEFRLL